jgi:hypothetical protein
LLRCARNDSLADFLRDHQVSSTKLQINLKFQIFNDPNRFDILNFGHCDLPFDLAQGGELVEPFDICVL